MPTKKALDLTVLNRIQLKMQENQYSPFRTPLLTFAASNSALSSSSVSLIGGPILIHRVLTRIEALTGFSHHQLMSTSRKMKLTVPRHTAMFFGATFAQDLSLPDLAQCFNREEHTTIMHGMRITAERYLEPADKHHDYVRFLVDRVHDDLLSSASFLPTSCVPWP